MCMQRSLQTIKLSKLWNTNTLPWQIKHTEPDFGKYLGRCYTIYLLVSGHFSLASHYRQDTVNSVIRFSHQCWTCLACKGTFATLVVTLALGGGVLLFGSADDKIISLELAVLSGDGVFHSSCDVPPRSRSIFHGLLCGTNGLAAALATWWQPSVLACADEGRRGALRSILR